MKKLLSLVLLLLLLSASLFAVDFDSVYAGGHGLPSTVMTLRFAGDYRQLKNKTDGVTKVHSIVTASDIDVYFNDYIGAFTTAGVIIPVIGTYEGRDIKWDQLDAPLFCKVGLIGRAPFRGGCGLEFRFGIGVNCNYQYSYWNYYPGYYGSTIAEEVKVTKYESQVVGGVDFYSFFDRNNAFGMRLGADVAYTFYSYVERTSSMSPSSSVSSLEITGFEIQPYFSFIFGF